MNHVILCNYVQTVQYHEFFIYGSSCSLSSSGTVEFAQLTRLHCPHAREHSCPCCLQLHRAEVQSALQLHRTTLSNAGGAGGKSTSLGTRSPLARLQPQFAGFCHLLNLATGATEGTLAGYGILWRWLLGANSVGGQRQHLWQPFGRIVDASLCQGHLLAFHQTKTP